MEYRWWRSEMPLIFLDHTIHQNSTADLNLKTILHSFPGFMVCIIGGKTSHLEILISPQKGYHRWKQHVLTEDWDSCQGTADFAVDFWTPKQEEK